MNQQVPTPADVPKWLVSTLRYLAAAYPNWNLTAATSLVYFDALQDLPQACVEGAARAFVREPSEFAPSAGQLRAEALKLRKATSAHPNDCGCLACIQALPVAERWLRMSPAMRTMLERNEPETARALAEAVPPQVRERLDGVRRLLSFPKAVSQAKEQQ